MRGYILTQITPKAMLAASIHLFLNDDIEPSPQPLPSIPFFVLRRFPIAVMAVVEHVAPGGLQTWATFRQPRARPCDLFRRKHFIPCSPDTYNHLAGFHPGLFQLNVKLATSAGTRSEASTRPPMRRGNLQEYTGS